MQEVNAFLDDAHGLQSLVHETCRRCRQEQCEDSSNNSVGHKVRQINDCLNELLSQKTSHLIQEDSDQNGHKRIQQQLYDRNDECVLE